MKRKQSKGKKRTGRQKRGEWGWEWERKAKEENREKQTEGRGEDTYKCIWTFLNGFLTEQERHSKLSLNMNLDEFSISTKNDISYPLKNELTMQQVGILIILIDIGIAQLIVLFLSLQVLRAGWHLDIGYIVLP